MTKLWDFSEERLAALEDFAESAEAELEELRTQNADLLSTCEWILQDLAYKAPEQIAPEIRDKYAGRLQTVIGKVRGEAV